MRRLTRIDLPPRVLEALASYQGSLDRAVGAEKTRKAPRIDERVDKAWRSRRSTKALGAVEMALRAMASGLERCMYCEDSRGCDIEHRHPKVSYPDRAFRWPNLLWICASCNRQKNAAFDDALLDPTTDDPLDHLVLSLKTGRYTARDESLRGAATLRVVRRLASDQTLARGRHHAVVRLRSLLSDYDAHLAAGRHEEAQAIRDVVVEEPFSAVFAAMLRASLEPGAGAVLGQQFVALLARHPEMRLWLAEADEARVREVAPQLAELARGVRIRRAGRKPRAKSRART